jgi:hypothetical protein
VKTAIVVGLLAVAVAGMVREPDATAPFDATRAARPQRDEARAFPLAGRWRYADTAGLLPRNSGCGVAEPALTITPHGVTLYHGPWRQPIFTFADWRLRGDTDLDIILAAGGSALLERARLTLDLAHAGFVRLKAATSPDGTPLGQRADSLPAVERDAARAEIAQVTGALTLIRCPDPSLDVTALLRGTTEAPLTKRFVR